MADMVLKGRAADLRGIGGVAGAKRAIREALWSVAEALGRGSARLASAMELGAFEIRAFDRSRKDSVD